MSLLQSRIQSHLPALSPISAAVEVLAHAGIEARGAIFTRKEVVEFILDLAGYTVDKPLFNLRLLEPSFGRGDFLLPAIERLLESWKSSPNSRKNTVKILGECIRAVELHHSTYFETKKNIIDLLERHKISVSNATELANKWLLQGDYLLTDLSGNFDFVVGNPPYVRQELIPDVLIAEYRQRYTTIYDRADLYIPFIERSLLLLKENGHLGFICADRWMKNRYGSRLRQLVSDNFHLKIYVDMVDTDAFQSDVSTYPAITVISRSRGTVLKIARQPEINQEFLKNLSSILVSNNKRSSVVSVIENVTSGSEPWILGSFDKLSLVRLIEERFPIIEDAGCKVGIGVATGADKAFIAPFDELDVESDRKLPLVMTKDINSGSVAWRGFGVINPFSDEGGLVDLADYPRLKRYLDDRKEQISGRHVAQKIPSNWYRTIDRIYPKIAGKKKLLIPDIKGDAQIVYEEGKLYPHHNLYYITSDDWDLRALQAVLLSGIAKLFVSTYSTKIRGGYLRFQAQYLRRIRIPYWNKVPNALRRELIKAADLKNVEACNLAVLKLYGLDKESGKALF